MPHDYENSLWEEIRRRSKGPGETFVLYLHSRDLKFIALFSRGPNRTRPSQPDSSECATISANGVSVVGNAEGWKVARAWEIRRGSTFAGRFVSSSPFKIITRTGDGIRG